MIPVWEIKSQSLSEGRTPTKEIRTITEIIFQVSLFLWYSIDPFYIELTSLYNQTSNSFQFLINAIIKTIGILSLFICIEFLPKDIWHKHLSYEIKLSIKWLACIISCSNELTCNVAILSNQSFQKHQQMSTVEQKQPIFFIS